MNARKIRAGLDGIGRRIVGTVARIKPPAIPPALLILMAEMGFVALFLTGLALEVNSAVALMTAGVLGVFAIERNNRKPAQ